MQEFNCVKSVMNHLQKRVKHSYPQKTRGEVVKKQTKVRIKRRAIAQKSGEPLIKLKKATTRDNTEENRQTSGKKN